MNERCAVKTFSKKMIPLLLSAGLVVGCQSNPSVNDGSDGSSGSGGMSDSSRTKTEGAAIGALLGGIIGAVAGDSKGAAIGALVGAGVGYAVGSEVAKRKQQYASTEAFLDAEIERTAEFNQTARQQHENMRREIASLDRETARLQQRYRAGSASRAQMQSKQRQLETRLAKNREFESVLQKEYEINSEILAQESKSRPARDPYLTQLQRENADLAKQIELLRQDSAQLAQINERLSV
jgi:uncharacterized protein YcfJ